VIVDRPPARALERAQTAVVADDAHEADTLAGSLHATGSRSHAPLGVPDAWLRRRGVEGRQRVSRSHTARYLISPPPDARVAPSRLAALSPQRAPEGRHGGLSVAVVMSSKVAWIFASPCNNRTCEVSFRPGIWKLQQLPSSQLRGHLSRRHAPPHRHLRGGSRLKWCRRWACSVSWRVWRAPPSARAARRRTP
jgi:hypothetical protein